jgi:hypothetical protein
LRPQFQAPRRSVWVQVGWEEKNVMHILWGFGWFLYGCGSNGRQRMLICAVELQIVVVGKEENDCSEKIIHREGRDNSENVSMRHDHQ